MCIIDLCHVCSSVDDGTRSNSVGIHHKVTPQARSLTVSELCGDIWVGARTSPQNQQRHDVDGRVEISLRILQYCCCVLVGSRSNGRDTGTRASVLIGRREDESESNKEHSENMQAWMPTVWSSKVGE